MLMWTPCGFHKKLTGTRYAELVFSHPMGSTGRAVYSGVSGRDMSMSYFSSSRRPGAVHIKTAPGHFTTNLRICILWDLRVTLCISVLPGCEM
jgi:hypothetical protein